MGRSLLVSDKPLPGKGISGKQEDFGGREWSHTLTAMKAALKTQARVCSSLTEYWRGLPCPSSGDLPDPGIEPTSLMSPAFAGEFFTMSATWEDLD